MMLPVAVMSLAMLVSYQRAKAESLGYEAKGGIMERAERFVVLAFGLLFNELLIWTLWVMAVLTAVTAVQRFVKIWRQASEGRPVRPRSRRRFRRTRTTRSQARVAETARRARTRNRPPTDAG